MKKIQCRLCAYWETPRHPETLGECHRRAPTPVADGFACAWPRTESGEWCGDGVDKTVAVDVIAAKPRVIKGMRGGAL